MIHLKLKEAFVTIKNGANISQNKTSGGIPITRIETISESEIDTNKLGYAGIEDGNFKDYDLTECDILMSHINSISHLGKVAIFEKRNEIIIHGMNLLCLKANKNLVYPKYAFYFFRTPLFINSIKKITKKSVNQASINISNLEEIPIILQEKFEDQIKIATILSKAEALIKQRKESIELLEKFLESSFVKLFGNPLNNTKDFLKINLKEAGNIVTGTTPPSKFEGMFGGDIPFITPGDLDSNEPNKRFVTEKGAQNSRIVRAGTTFVCCIGATIGKVGRAKVISTLNQQINAIEWYKEFNDFFGEMLMRFMKPLIASQGSTSTTLPILNKGDFEKIEIIKPPIELQNKFAQIVEKVEILKAQFKESLVELENLFGSLSQKAFKGELDLSRMEVQVKDQLDNTEINFIASKPAIEAAKHLLKKTRQKDLKTTSVWNTISSEQTSKWVKEKYTGYHFTSEMLIRFLTIDKNVLPDYYSSEDLKKYPVMNESADIKSFIFSAVNKENSYLKLEQVFYNAEEENLQLEVSEEDFELIKDKSSKNRSGIYFTVVE